MAKQPQHEMKVVERWEDIPTFETEDEEHNYWAIHTLSQALLNHMEPIDDGFLPASRPLTTSDVSYVKRYRAQTRADG